MVTEYNLDPGSDRPSLVVVGNGMVGHQFIKKLKAHRLHEVYDVTVFGAEQDAAYDRVALSSYMTKVSKEDLSLLSDGDYEGIATYLGEEITEIDVSSKKIASSAGKKVSYDILVLATGSTPFVPPIPGAQAKGCHVYRTFFDLDQIKESASGASGAVVVGGGLLGLEAAGALKDLGLEIDIVELSNRPLPLQVDEGGGAIVRRYLEELGLGLHFSTAMTSVEVGNDDTVRAVRLSDGSEIPTDVVVFATGVRPNDRLAREAGLDIGPRGGVAVDNHCQSSDPSIFAIGECASANGVVYGLIAPGNTMAEVVADFLAGKDGSFEVGDTSTKLKLLGVEVASFGDAFATTEGALDVTFMDSVAKTYKKLILSNDAKHLLGGILVGDVSSYGLLRSLCNSPSDLSVEVEQLLLPMNSGAMSASVMDPKATVCSCNNVSLSEVRECIKNNDCWELGAVKTATSAGTGCGSCVGLVKSILEEELALAGKEVSKALCQHFTYSRQELFDLVRVHQISSFSQLIDSYGVGRGCDICKPAVASILASCHGTHPLEGELAAIQDTNDHVLANLQKDGSYSVVPRIPGGEITPEGLVAIGTIAKEFNLYTKITGAQRIDMFGARLEDLPKIWRRLVDQGFESGHAYGKALRTVKSCVGSTWCRYGVQDAVGLAIELELRYRGLRSPHKIKAGVSGCARECAEAKGKDIGVIATERGWNLYIGGNGGFTPRHAELLASDLDRETLIRYIDRYLMYYIRTADRLQRTAAWIESLDGGLSHVIDVVVKDTLGIGAELETAMDKHVRSYQDEWSATLEDPEKLNRFVTFINDPSRSDPSITFVPERSQHKPATPVKLSAKKHGGFTNLETKLDPCDKNQWTEVCGYNELLPERPVAAWVSGSQVAVVKLSDGSVHAVDNQDPISGANVMARGLVGTKGETKVIISPMYKHSFNLETGHCLDDPDTNIKVRRARVNDGKVEVAW